MAELTQMGEILVDQLADREHLITALIRASGGSITVPNDYLADVDGLVLTRVDNFAADATVFSVRRVPAGIWKAYTESECRHHLNNLMDVRGPGGWRHRGPGYDHEHWVPVESEDPDLVADIEALVTEDIHSPASWYESPASQSEILPLSDQVQPLEPLLPRIRSLALPDGRFAFVVSGWTPPEDPDKAQEFRVRMAGFGRMCGAIATTVFEEHIEVS